MPTTTPERPQEPDLEPWFAAGRDAAPEPAPDFLSRLADIAEAEASAMAPAPEPRTGLRAWLSRAAALVAPRGAETAGLAAAALAGLWLGIAPPEPLSGGIEALRGAGTLASEYEAAALVDPLGARDLAWLME